MQDFPEANVSGVLLDPSPTKTPGPGQELEGTLWTARGSQNAGALVEGRVWPGGTSCKIEGVQRSTC